MITENLFKIDLFEKSDHIDRNNDYLLSEIYLSPSMYYELTERRDDGYDSFK